MKRIDETYAERLEDITVRCFRGVNTLDLKAQHVISVIYLHEMEQKYKSAKATKNKCCGFIGY